MKRSVNMKIVCLSFLLIAIIFASTTFGVFEGMTDASDMPAEGLTPEQLMTSMNQNGQSEEEEDPITTNSSMQAFRSR